MDGNTPAAPAPVTTGESEANNSNNTSNATTPAGGDKQPVAPAEPDTNSVDLHGFTSEQLAEMRKFYDSNGGFEAVKSKISNPPKPQAPAPQPEQKPEQNIPSNTQPAQASQNGVRSANSLAMELFFDRLAQKPEYAGFSKEISDGTVIKEMLGMGMNPLTADGGINTDQLNKFLDLKAKASPAPVPSTTPEASAAPTADYIQVGETITSQDEALNVLKQNVQLRAMGQAEHPATAKAKEFLKTHQI